ncbi:hypothetical protein CLV76_13118 [Marivita geojedonensis]|nr:hypothetical protein CLV76_13118 [Marivita geojedonensis]
MLASETNEMPRKQENKTMGLFRKFRNLPRASSIVETAEAERFLRRGPNDKPAGIRHNHTLLRSLGGW